MRRVLLCMAGLAVATVAPAFPFDTSWHMPAAGDTPNGDYYDPQGISGNNRAGAGGIYGLGSTQDHGIRCSSCHIEGATYGYGLIDADVSVTPAWQNVGGDDAYSPGTTYNFTVTLLNEHRHPAGGGNDLNGMSVGIEDANGQTAGVYVTDSGARSDACPAAVPGNLNPPTHTTFVYGDCHGVLSIAEINVTSWSFQWIAPAAGAGDLTLYYTVVDGDHNGDNSLDDDVKEGTIPLREGT